MPNPEEMIKSYSGNRGTVYVASPLFVEMKNLAKQRGKELGVKIETPFLSMMSGLSFYLNYEDGSRVRVECDVTRDGQTEMHPIRPSLSRRQAEQA